VGGAENHLLKLLRIPTETGAPFGYFELRGYLLSWWFVCDRLASGITHIPHVLCPNRGTFQEKFHSPTGDGSARGHRPLPGKSPVGQSHLCSFPTPEQHAHCSAQLNTKALSERGFMGLWQRKPLQPGGTGPDPRSGWLCSEA